MRRCPLPFGVKVSGKFGEVPEVPCVQGALSPFWEKLLRFCVPSFTGVMWRPPFDYAIREPHTHIYHSRDHSTDSTLR